MYESLVTQPGWLDFLALAIKYRDELAADLLAGSFSDSRRRGPSDDALRGAIFGIDRLLAIPAEAKVRYELMRRAEDHIAGVQKKLDSAQDWE